MPFKFNPTTGQLDLVGTGGGGGATSLNGLSDVDLTTNPPEEGEALVYDGSGFVPASPPVYVEVQNNSGADISKGTPVYVSGTAGSGNPEIGEADSDGVDTFPAIGLVANTITDGSSGRVLVSGVLEGLDTSLFGANDALYLSSTTGQLANVRPTADTEKVQKVGLVTRSHASSGRILVIGAGRTNDVPNELTALTGVALNDTDLGSFTGELIPDGQNIKEALQTLETVAETVAGVDTQVLFNDGGAFGGDAGLTYDKTTDKLTVGGDIDLDDGGTFSTTLQTVTPTANRTVSIPDATGTIGLVNGPTGSIQFNEAGVLNGTSDFSTTLNWNNAVTTFTGLKLNVTDTASAADSNLLDLQLNGSSLFLFTSTGQIKQVPVAVSALPVAATVGAGTRGFVNDANATTFASVVAGGGANTVPVYSDGTNWLIG